jgi:methylase of polypeptide subunit release factors
VRRHPEDKSQKPLLQEDEMSVEYLFRTYNEMPKLEQKTCNQQGEILDVGCGAGSHICIYKRNLEVYSIDISPNAISL